MWSHVRTVLKWLVCVPGLKLYVVMERAIVLVSLTDFREGYFKALNLSFSLKDIVPHIYVAILSLK